MNNPKKNIEMYSKTKKIKNGSVKSKKTKIANIFSTNTNPCNKYYDDRLTKPLVPEFENLTVMQNPTLQEVYDSHVTDYRKLIPHKEKVGGEHNFKSEGAYNNMSYTVDTWKYDKEDPMNGGEIDNNLYGFDPLFDGKTSIF
jgi:hypothetical protein